MSNQVYANDIIPYFQNVLGNIEQELNVIRGQIGGINVLLTFYNNNLIQPPVPLLCNMVGPFVATQFQLKYVVQKNIVRIYWNPLILTATQNSFTITSSPVLPSNITPPQNVYFLVPVEANGIKQGILTIDTNGVLTFSLIPSSNFFANGQPAGILANCITYSI